MHPRHLPQWGRVQATHDHTSWSNEVPVHPLAADPPSGDVKEVVRNTYHPITNKEHLMLYDYERHNHGDR